MQADQLVPISDENVGGIVASLGIVKVEVDCGEDLVQGVDDLVLPAQP